jgi:hypothetical protein
MRDPDLVQRAERAAFALERAWDRWRTMHGYGSDPLPPVSSYVGYSLEEPWGQPRVVFGVDAEEAELLAALLDGHDCVGPVHAELTASSEWRRAAANGMGTAPWPPADQLSIPAQAPQPGSEMLPTASQTDVDGGPAESATSTLPGPDVREPGRADGAANGAAATDVGAGAKASDGVPLDSGPSDRDPSDSGPSGHGSSDGGLPGGGSSEGGPSGGGPSGGGPSGGGPSGGGPSGGGPSRRGPSGGGLDPATAADANGTNGRTQSTASRPKPRKLPAASPNRTAANGHSGGTGAPAVGPQAAPAPGQLPSPPQPGTQALRPLPTPLGASPQAEPPAPMTSSDDLLPVQGRGHLGPRYQGYPPQYQDGPRPGQLRTAYAAAPVADSDVRASASQPERGKSRQLPRLGRTRRQGPGAHEAWGSAGDQSAADHAV